MNQILPRLYLGSFADAEQLTADDCQYVITLCEAVPQLVSGITLCHLPMPDEVYLGTGIWQQRVTALTNILALHTAPSVLVHCRLGVSRSPSLVAAYLTRYGWTLETALALLVSRRGVVAPHHETWRGVQAWVRQA